jgi:hypothetical protein
LRHFLDNCGGRCSVMQFAVLIASWSIFIGRWSIINFFEHGSCIINSVTLSVVYYTLLEFFCGVYCVHVFLMFKIGDWMTLLIEPDSRSTTTHMCINFGTSKAPFPLMYCLSVRILSGEVLLIWSTYALQFTRW